MVLNKAIDLEKSGNYRRALDELYQTFDYFYENNLYKECDEFLLDIDVNQLNIHLMIGLLAITKDEGLLNRMFIASKIENRIRSLDPDRADRLLQGLI